MNYCRFIELSKVGRIRCYCPPPPPPHVISFSNGCALIPQPEALENVSRVIIHYLKMT